MLAVYTKEWMCVGERGGVGGKFYQPLHFRFGFYKGLS